MQAFKCPQCGRVSRSMLEVTYNVIEYGDIYIDEDPNISIPVTADGDSETTYHESKTVYRCTNCNYELPDVHGVESLETYLRNQT